MDLIPKVHIDLKPMVFRGGKLVQNADTIEWLSKEIIDRCDHFYLQTAGIHHFPNSAEGDILKMAYKLSAKIRSGRNA